jgi:hypothetical protein
MTLECPLILGGHDPYHPHVINLESIRINLDAHHMS